MFKDLKQTRMTNRALLAGVAAFAVLSTAPAQADNPQARAVEPTSPGVEAAVTA